MILEGDCIAVMGEMADASIDAVITDPPYGLEFMGKGWDSFRIDDPGTMRHRGEAAGSHGTLKADNPTLEAAGRVEYGAGKRPTTSRCTGCGKRDQFRNPHGCEDSGRSSVRWVTEYIDPHAAPPASLAYGEWCRTWALEAYRVAKPGAHLLAFGGTRTVHRLTCALEDAGWEIRDTLVWAYASGFPKSLDVSKAIDKSRGTDTTADERWTPTPHAITGAMRTASGRSEQVGQAVPGERVLYAPATPEAEAWTGWGTALKPAWEPIVLARKPLTGSVASNVLAHGTGALNIDATRIPFVSDADREQAIVPQPDLDTPSGNVYGFQTGEGRNGEMFDATRGRWPANVVLTDPIFDVDTPGVVGGGEAGDFTRGGYLKPERSAEGAMFAGGRLDAGNTYGDAGTYSRFFLIPKAARSDREPVVGGGIPMRKADVGDDRPSGTFNERLGERQDGSVRAAPIRENVHPTVKPVELMRHLVRLVTPPGGTVLDPFLGSGTTGIAAELEGFAWIGIEREAEYVAIAQARLNGTQRGLGLDVAAPTTKRAGRSKGHWPATRGKSDQYGGGPFSGQLGLEERTE